MYLSPTWHAIEPEYRAEFGYILNLHLNGGNKLALPAGRPWMLDNNAYTGKFREDRWFTALERYQPYATTCIAVVIPDVLHITDTGVIGDWRATLDQYHHYAPYARAAGYRTAFVTQDGLPLNRIPWSEFDALFIGGSDHHKLVESWPLIAAGLAHDKHIHVARVNSAKRILMFWQADTWDGTTLKIDPSRQRQWRLIRAARAAHARKHQGTLL